MNWSFDDPRWLAVVLVGVVCAWLGWRWLRAVPRVRRAPAVFLRVALMAVIGLALAGLHADREADRVAVVAAVDLSGSVMRYGSYSDAESGEPLDAQAAIWSWLGVAAGDRRADDPFGLVVFDGRASAIATPTLTDPLTRIPTGASTDGTDVGAAIDLARAMLPADAAQRIILVSDGRATASDLDSIVSDVPIDVLPIRYQVEREVVVERFDMPSRTAGGAEIDARVVLNASGASRGTLTVRRDGRPVDLTPGAEGTGLRIELAPGRRVVPVRFALPQGRVHRFEAVYEPDRGESDGRVALLGDTTLENNRAEGFAITRAPGSVLLVSGGSEATGSSELIAQTLRNAGKEVERISAASFPTSLLDLEAHDLVVLDNVPIDALPMGSDATLGAYAKSFGGGIIFVGGRSALTAGSWRGSEIEDDLPVILEVPERVVMPEAAVVIVLDRSGSMKRSVMGSSRSQQTVANESAAGAIDTLDPNDYIGVVSFSNEPTLVVPVTQNTNPEQTRSRVLAISSNGGTNLGPAMRMAWEQLQTVEAGTKHVIVLTDGQSQNTDALPQIAADMLSAGIRVSTIAVGDDADIRTLRDIASEGDGTAYIASNPTRLPQLFITAVRVVRTPAINENPFTPIVVEPDAIVLSGVGEIPTLLGFVMTTKRDEASTPVVNPDDQPIIASWPVELGRIAVITTDAGEWARNWSDDDGFAPFWVNLASQTIRAFEDTPGELTMSPAGGGDVTLVYEALEETGTPMDGLGVRVDLFTAGGGSRTVDLRQTGPGRYEGRARGVGPGVHVGAAKVRLDGAPLAPSVAGVAVRSQLEDLHLSSDEAALVNLAARTGGRVLEWATPEPLFERTGSMRVIRSALWPILISAALWLFLLDVAMRRIAWDRWVEDARMGTIAAAADPVSSLGQLRSRSPGSQGPTDVQRRQQAQAERTKQSRARSRRAVEEARSRVAGDKPAMDEGAKPEPEQESGLLAAKRRARKRLDES